MLTLTPGLQSLHKKGMASYGESTSLNHHFKAGPPPPNLGWAKKCFQRECAPRCQFNVCIWMDPGPCMYEAHVLERSNNHSLTASVLLNLEGLIFTDYLRSCHMNMESFLFQFKSFWFCLPKGSGYNCQYNPECKCLLSNLKEKPFRLSPPV